MATTFELTKPIRRVAVGDCSGPQGADGIAELTRTAHESLLAQEWKIDESAAFLPVHDNGQISNKSIPSGDAWKCSYGYDAVARTERSACGAVCYSFRLPDDAIASGNVANIYKIEFSLTGDRYLADGVDVLYAVSAGDGPTDGIGEILSTWTVKGPYCDTSSQTEPPNQRHGVTTAISIKPGASGTPYPAGRYLHIVLALHDYESHRGAWVEGGAMLDGAKISVTFTRDVEPGVSAATIDASLFLITGNLNNVSGDYTLANIRTVSFFVNTYWYYYKTAYGAPWVERGIEFDRFLPLVKSGRPSVAMGEYRFKAYNDNRIQGIFIRSSTNQAGFLQYFFSTVGYFAPNTPMTGLTFTLPGIKVYDMPSGVTAVLRAGLVQVDTIPEENTSASGQELYFAIPWTEVVDGAGDNLLGYSDTTFSTNETKRIYVTVARQQTKPYIFPVVLPVSVSGATDNSVFFEQTDPAPPVRMDAGIWAP